MPRDFGSEARSRRARDLSILVGAVLLVLLGRLVHIQLIRGTHFQILSEENRVDREILRADRGRIFDRNGEVLADNYPTYRLSLDPRDPAYLRDPARLSEVVSVLAKILEREAGELEEEILRVRRRSARPVPLSRNLSFRQVALLEERMVRLPGVLVETASARRYPGGARAGHLLGYLGEVSEGEVAEGNAHPYHPGDFIGRSGIERQYEDLLRGEDGEVYVEVDAFGRRTHLFPQLPTQPSIPGKDVVLTIDLPAQRAAEAALDSTFAHGKPRDPADSTGSHHGQPGAVVAIDPRTGEVLVLASRPAFDPNLFLRGLTRAEWREIDAATHPLLNRAIQSAYPPGSTFKVLTSLAGLEAGVITPTRTFSGCGGGYFYGNRTFRCWKKEGHGTLRLAEAFTRSCDVYYYQVGVALGIERLGEFASRLGLGARTGIDLPQEKTGLMPTPEWYLAHYGKGGIHRGAALNVAIGQGEVLMTPVALARFTAAVANGGRMLRPHLLLRTGEPNGTIQRDTSEEDWEESRLPVQSEYLTLVQEAMEQVVMSNSGTGTRARVETLRIAGKTGTAQNPHGEDHALFVCYAPVEDPRIAVAVVVEEAGHGGAVAAPIARQVLAAYFRKAIPSAGQTSAASGGAWEGD